MAYALCVGNGVCECETNEQDGVDEGVTEPQLYCGICEWGSIDALQLGVILKRSHFFGGWDLYKTSRTVNSK